MNILMLSALDVWSLADGKGAPTLYRTLNAYGERGHHVHFLAPTVGANRFGPTTASSKRSRPSEIANVTFTRFDVPSLSRLRLPLPQIAAKADQKLRFATAFPIIAARRAESLLRRHDIDLLYAYEVHGALAVRLLQRKWKLPTVCRFQGTIMHPYLDDRLALLRRREEVLALRTPADLYVMTNDGTRGDEVLARLNPRSQGHVCFWRNGLDLERLIPSSVAAKDVCPQYSGHRYQPVRHDDGLCPPPLEAGGQGDSRSSSYPPGPAAGPPSHLGRRRGEGEPGSSGPRSRRR